jgi:hypothetical protein
MRRKKGAISAGTLAAVIIASIVIGGGGLLWANNAGLLGGGGSTPNFQFQIGGQQQQQQGPAGGCGDSKSTTLTVTLVNGEDEAGGTFDATGYLYGASGDFKSITDTTAGTATVNCGEQYTLKLVRQDANKGDNSRITEILPGSVAGATVVDGAAVFTPLAPNVALNIKGSQHGVLEFRAFDKDNNGFMCDSDASCTAWEADGVVFESTTNATALAVGSGGEINIELYYRANETVTNFNDFGYWILIDAGTTIWNIPSCRLDGALLTDQKGTFNVNEARQFSGYEYAYRIDGDVRDSQHTLACNFKALAGVNPGATDDIEIDFAAIGQFLGTDGVTVKRSAADDTSSSAVVFTVMDTKIDIS